MIRKDDILKMDGKGYFRIPLLPVGGLQGGKELPEPFL